MSRAALLGHLATGTTTVCRCWRVRRQDGVVLGFTDHDRDLTFDGTVFRAGTGLSARAIVQGMGLSVDNGEALGVLSDAAMSEADIAAGRYDEAEVEEWLVNWSAPDERMQRFAGQIGEIRRGGGGFQAELRGLTDLLNQPRGQVYHPTCGAQLGDARCRFDLGTEGFAAEREIFAVTDARLFELAGLETADPGWFEQGKLMVLDGAASGLSGVIKRDRLDGGMRRVELWAPVGAAVAPGDRVRVVAGCDRRIETCRMKFDNVVNFRGFPAIPGEDWLIGNPAARTRG